MSNLANSKIVVGRYALLPNPKRGGMAEIYKALDTQRDGCPVAIKMFRHDILTAPLALEAFRRETQAIKSCVHPNIIEHLGDGTDDASGRHFLVLEWMTESLEEFLLRETFQDWDDFYARLGKPILDALALAHNRRVIHRDLKPSNVLFTEFGTPKLADFSISKIKRWADEGLTLSNFASPPYAPPEQETQPTYSCDVFSFAVLAVRCLSSYPIKDYDDVARALTSVPAPSSVKEILQTCLADPDERPFIAGLLLNYLDAIQRERGKRDKLRVPIFFILSGKARERVTREFALEARNRAEAAVVADLQEMPALSRTGLEGPMELYGGRCSYRVSLPRQSRHSLFIEDAHNVPSDILAKKRERALSLHCDFKPERPIRIAEAVKNLEKVLDDLDHHEAELRQLDAIERENQLFDNWITTLRAKAEVEREKQPVLRITSAKLDGARAVLTLLDKPTDELLGQQLEIRGGNKLYAIGEIESLNGSVITFGIRKSHSPVLPKAGELAVDISLSRIAIERQWNALDSVRYQRCARPALRELLVFPGGAALPQKISRTINFFQDRLTDDKKRGIEIALGTPDFVLVEGPPGTGKTTFITELILQLIAENPRIRILLTSQTHVALDHVLDALGKLHRPVDAIRIGRLGDARISAIGGELLFERRLEEWRQRALESGRRFLERLANRTQISIESIRDIVLVRRLISSRNQIKKGEFRLRELEEELVSATRVSTINSQERELLSANAKALRDQIDHEEEEYEAARRSKLNSERLLISSGRFGENLDEMTDADLEHAAASPVKGKPEYQFVLRMAQLHADWETRCGRSPDFEAAVLSSVQLVAGTCVGIESSRGAREVEFDLCIVDEASKAAPTELLIPLAKAKRWILVGDERQLPPFVDRALIRGEILRKYELTKEQLQDTLFNRLKGSIPDVCHVELRSQHRMIPAIGHLISECFYDGTLSSEHREWDRAFSAILTKPVVWFTTARNQRRSEIPAGPSCINRLEIRTISALIDRLEDCASRAQKTYSVGVLSPYGAQKQALERSLAVRMESARYLNIECNTVDAFQGREVDVAIFSITRSNPRRRLGFLDEFRRLNVALSRAREYLIIVGDHQFCLTAAEPNPLRPVIAHIRRNPQECTMLDAQA